MTDTLFKIVSAVLLGLLLGFGAYHWSEVKGLKHQIDDQTATITKINNDKATLSAENTVLRKSNSDFAELSKKQNAAVEAMQKERDDAKTKWQAEVEAGKKRSATFSTRIAKIESTVAAAGQSWCDAWKGLVDPYYVDRGAK